MKTKDLIKTAASLALLMTAQAIAQNNLQNPAANTKTSSDVPQLTEQMKPGTSENMPISLKDVESLLDKNQHLDGYRVTVQGKMKSKIDTNSFVFEGGGLVNDEVVVIVPKKGKNLPLHNISDKSKIRVTGHVRTAPLSEIKREYQWAPEARFERKLSSVKAFIIADDVKKQ